MTIEQLKAAAYDTLVGIETLQKRLQQINAAIVEASKPQAAEEAPKDDAQA